MKRSFLILSGIGVLYGFGLTGCATQSAAPPPTLSAKKPLSPLIYSIWGEAEPDEGPAPLKVRFKAEPMSKQVDLKQTRFVWEFADESPRGEGTEVEHTFKTPGTYTVRVIATDHLGGRADHALEIEVGEPD